MENYNILLDQGIYGEHNTIGTIEQCYVKPLKKDIEIWEEICRQLPEQENFDTLSDLQNTLHFFEDNKDKLGGV